MNPFGKPRYIMERLDAEPAALLDRMMVKADGICQSYGIDPARQRWAAVPMGGGTFVECRFS